MFRVYRKYGVHGLHGGTECMESPGRVCVVRGRFASLSHQEAYTYDILSEAPCVRASSCVQGGRPSGPGETWGKSRFIKLGDALSRWTSTSARRPPSWPATPLFCIPLMPPALRTPFDKRTLCQGVSRTKLEISYHELDRAFKDCGNPTWPASMVMSAQGSRPGSCAPIGLLNQSL